MLESWRERVETVSIGDDLSLVALNAFTKSQYRKADDHVWNPIDCKSCDEWIVRDEASTAVHRYVIA